MKKFLFILLISLLVVSVVPLVLAEDGSNDRSGSDDFNPSVKCIQKCKIVDGETVCETECERLPSTNTRAPAPNRMINGTSDDDDDDSNATETDDDSDDDSNDGNETDDNSDDDHNKTRRERLLEAREKLLQARLDFVEKRKNFQDVREQVREACKDNKTSEECIDAQAKALADAKSLVADAADEAITYLESVKSNVENNTELSDEKKAELLADLNESIADLEKAKADAEAATTKEEVQAAAKEVKQVWVKIKHNVQRHAVLVLTTQLENLIERFQANGDKLQCAIDAMNASGNDTASLETSMDAFNADVSEAETSSTKARDLLEQAQALDPDTDKDKIRELLEDSRVEIKSAYVNLREAYATMKTMTKSIKDSGVDVSSCKLGMNGNSTVEG